MKDVAVLAAGGAVGQRFVERLAHHPWFRPRLLVGSPEKVGQRYAEATRWLLDSPIPEQVGDQTLVLLDDLLSSKPGVAFSALPSGTAGPIETRLAENGWQVFSNARDHRMGADVPLLITEVNPDHLALARRQATPGRIMTNGNCGAIVMILGLAPIYRALGISELHCVTQQALSGAGYPGVSALDVTDNILTYLPGEEEKLAAEPRKTLGALGTSGIQDASFPVYATATRVPVREGHTVHVHLKTEKPTTTQEVARLLADFRGPKEVAVLPSAPQAPVHVFSEPDRPQPRRDRFLENGMATAAGRIRVTSQRNVQFTILGSNTVRGAAGQSILNAELAHKVGL